MCIRDSIEVELGFDEATAFKEASRCLNCDVQTVFNRDTCICLLYTSDAADERSSVDLGGRRIIKKKKRKKMSSSGNRRREETIN